MKFFNVYKAVFVLFVVILGTNAQAQISFEERTEDFGIGHHNSGVPMAFGDLNGDQWPDLVVLDQTNDVVVYLNHGREAGFSRSDLSFESNTVWSIALADIDHNGREDILLGKAAGNKELLFTSVGLDPFELLKIDESNIFVQGIYFIDMDGDGDLDIYLCDDNAENKCYQNLYPQQDFEIVEWIDHGTTPPSDNSGNYSMLWSDLDMDGDLDGYLAKCRFGVDEPTDPRRINQYFEQMTPQMYEEKGVAWGLDIGDQSWSADAGDLDGDGDMDMVVIHHGAPVSLLENRGDTFVTQNLNLQPQTSALQLQVHLADFDNDGDLDILSTGEEVILWENKGDLQFEGVADFRGLKRLGSSIIGDVNGDGKIDVFANQGVTLNTPSSRPDLLWINSTEDTHNYVQFKLQGSLPNPSAIGARVDIYSALGKQIRELRSGHSYGVHNASWIHFGLGEDDVIDSVVVRWPSGTKDVFTELAVNQHWLVQEGRCITAPLSIESSGISVFCLGDSLGLWIDQADSVYWSDGSTDDTLTVGASGTYSARAWKEGCLYMTESISVVVDPEQPASVDQLSNVETMCFGDSTALVGVGDHLAYHWNTGVVSDTLWVDSAGAYWATAQGYCREWATDTVNIELTTEIPRLPDLTDTVMSGVVSWLRPDVIGGFEIRWFLDSVDGSAIAVSDSISLTLEQAGDTCMWFSRGRSSIDTSTVVGEAEHEGGSKYASSSLNEGMRFDVLQDCELNSVTVFTDFPGWRVLELYDVFLNQIYRDSFYMISGANKIELAWPLPSGEDYVLTTDAEVNDSQFSGANPLLWRTTSNFVDYPYTDEAYLTIKGTQNGTPGYFYFYDWNIVERGPYCESERTRYCVVSDNMVSLDPRPGHQGELSLNLRPMPFGDRLFVDLPQRSFSYVVYNYVGTQIAKGSGFHTTELNTSQWFDGIYIMSVLDGDANRYQRVIIRSR